MFNSIGNHAQGKRRRLVTGLVFGCAVGYDAGKLRDFPDPPAVFLAFDFDRQHDRRFQQLVGITMERLCPVRKIWMTGIRARARRRPRRRNVRGSQEWAGSRSRR